jgi:4'-phosphopantetheinyl transferase
MIDWLVQPTSAHPDLARGVAPAGLLSERERMRLGSLTVEKRRRDWLLGRWTAKHLLQSAIERRTGVRLSLDALSVESAEDGAPVVSGDRRLEISDRGSDLQSLISNLQSLSL